MHRISPARGSKAAAACPLHALRHIYAAYDAYDAFAASDVAIATCTAQHQMRIRNADSAAARPAYSFPMTALVVTDPANTNLGDSHDMVSWRVILCQEP